MTTSLLVCIKRRLSSCWHQNLHAKAPTRCPNLSNFAVTMVREINTKVGVLAVVNFTGMYQEIRLFTVVNLKSKWLKTIFFIKLSWSGSLLYQIVVNNAWRSIRLGWGECSCNCPSQCYTIHCSKQSARNFCSMWGIYGHISVVGLTGMLQQIDVDRYRMLGRRGTDYGLQ